MSNPVATTGNDVAQAIQLALGPTFLLTATAGMLNVMAGRLSRIIDRGRHLTEARGPLSTALPEAVHSELRSLERRRHLASRAITACTLAALLVCIVIVTLFLEAMLNAPLQWLTGLLFIGAALSLVVGLAFFLREVHLATHLVRILTKETRHPR